MQVFANTADPKELEKITSELNVDGVTMNPTMLARAGCIDVSRLVRDLMSVTDGKIFVPVMSTNACDAVNEALAVAALSDRVVVKLPSTPTGFTVCRRLGVHGVQVNMTLCFSTLQVVEAARSGATWVSPFLGRMDDAGGDGRLRLSEMLSIIGTYDFRLTVLAASLRTKDSIASALLTGAHAITLDPEQLRTFGQDELSDTGAAQFDQDWLQWINSRSGVPAPSGHADQEL